MNMKYWFYSYIYPNKELGGMCAGNAYQKCKYFNIKEALKFQKDEGREVIILYFVEMSKKQYDNI